MKYIYTTFIGLMCFGYTSVYGQTDSLTVLSEVVLSDVVLKQFSPSQQIRTISDSVSLLTASRMTETLRYNSLIYLRENGPGGVASPSFRGTSAQQTAVVWNGININSQLNGQSDLNTIATRNYDAIAIRKGGGSIPYGSGAVGGTIHLDNSMQFEDRWDTKLTTSAGSFQTYALAGKTTFATPKSYADIGVDYTQSANDFEYQQSPLVNENGAFSTLGFNTNLGWQLTRPERETVSQQQIKVYHNSFFGDRAFSRTLTAPSQTGYQDIQSRTMLEFEAKKAVATTSFKLAQLFEQFKFFSNAENPENYTIGKSMQYLGQVKYTHKFGADKRLQSILEYHTTTASGSSIVRAERRNYAGILLWRQQLQPRWGYTLQIRQDINSDFESPFLVSGGSYYDLLQQSDKPNRLGYRISVNGSRNYRVPTFNDLYWLGPGAAGNASLRPESSWQAEIGHQFRYKSLRMRLNGYYIHATNLINWQPNSSGVWSPVNVNRVTHQGIETTLGYDMKWLKHQLAFDLQYGYTQAIDERSQKTLIYTPMHKATLSVHHRWKWLQLHFQHLVVGSVFTTTDNAQSLNGYQVSNLICQTDIVSSAKNTWTISLQAKNLFNTNYQTIAFRPNPGRHFNIQTTFIF